MAEQLLDAAQIRSHVQKVSGKAVAQRVRMNVALRAADQRVACDVARNASRGEPATAAIQEHGRAAAELCAPREIRL